jgi:hypothetical protein
MPSNARNTLDANRDDLDRLWEIHQQEAGTTRGRKYEVEVINKAAVVLVCAAWEAYCEDIVHEAIQNIVNDCADYNKLPKELKTEIAKRIRDDKHDHAPWLLAGNGWKTVLANNASDILQGMTGRWNTPKSEPVQKLFEKALGITNITSHWHWTKNPVTHTTKKLDDFVTLRGEIAHRQKPKDSVHKNDGTGFYDLVCRLADSVDDEVKKVLYQATGKNYW